MGTSRRYRSGGDVGAAVVSDSYGRSDAAGLLASGEWLERMQSGCLEGRRWVLLMWCLLSSRRLSTVVVWSANGLEHAPRAVAPRLSAGY